MSPLFYTIHMYCLKALLALPLKYIIIASIIAASVQGTESRNHYGGEDSSHCPQTLPAHRIVINQIKAIS